MPPTSRREETCERKPHEVMTHEFGIECDALAALEGQLVAPDFFGVGHKPRSETIVLLYPLELTIKAIRCASCDGDGNSDQDGGDAHLPSPPWVGECEPSARHSFIRPKADCSALR